MFLKMNIKDINFDEEKPVFKTENQSFIFDKVVIACGAFSKKLTDQEIIDIYKIIIGNVARIIDKPILNSLFL